MKKLLVAGLGLVALALGVVYGPALVSYAIIPPRHGIYRHYRTGFFGPHWYWEYLFVSEGRLVSADFPEKVLFEDSDVRPGRDGTLLLYDYRGEFDGVIAFTRTELTRRHPDGRENRYAREFNLWKVWREQFRARGQLRSSRPLEGRKRAYTQMINNRMKEQSVAVPPAARAASRPPAIAAPTETPGPRPLIAVMEGYGLHSRPETTFALYEDGMMICRSPDLDLDEPFHTITAPNGGKLMREIFPFDVAELPGRYVLSSATDQPGTSLWISGKIVEIYGPWRKPVEFGDSIEDETYRKIEAEERKLWETLPAPLRDALWRIEAFRARKGTPWLPEKIEVEFQDYEHCRDDPIFWPRKWPGLYDPTSIKHNEDDYSVFVPSGDFAELRTFLATRKELGAVMIDLNKMAPYIRFPLPRESAWRR